MRYFLKPENLNNVSQLEAVFITFFHAVHMTPFATLSLSYECHKTASFIQFLGIKKRVKIDSH